MIQFIFFLSVLLRLIQGVSQICNPGKGNVVYQFSVDTCPFGILFENPLYAGCLRSSPDNDVSSFFADICKGLKYHPKSRPFLQYIPVLTPGQLSESESCLGNGTGQCKGPVLYINSTDFTAPRNDLTFLQELNFEHPNEGNYNDSLLVDQTYRMFKFIAGVQNDGEDFIYNDVEGRVGQPNDGIAFTPSIDGPVTRTAELLHQSFRVLAKHCNSSYVPYEFGQDIRKMFLFLLREGDIGQCEDIKKEEFEVIQEALKQCYQMKTPFEIKGPSCKTYSKATYIEKNGNTYPYKPDSFSFVPYKYDIVVDATWGVVDFVHGLCFGSFDFHLNSHHLYQRAMENLFIEGILYRWPRPSHLFKEEIWNNMLSTSTRETMRSLDVCIHGAYADVPFLHRLERLVEWSPDLPSMLPPTPPQIPTRPPRPPPTFPPKGTTSFVEDSSSEEEMDTTPGSASTTTTKSPISIPTLPPDTVTEMNRRVLPEGVTVFPFTYEGYTPVMSLNDVGLSESGWCFQKEDERVQGLKNYIDTHCPDSGILALLNQEGEGSMEDGGYMVPVDYVYDEETTVSSTITESILGANKVTEAPIIIGKESSTASSQLTEG